MVCSVFGMARILIIRLLDPTVFTIVQDIVGTVGEGSSQHAASSVFFSATYKFRYVTQCKYSSHPQQPLFDLHDYPTQRDYASSLSTALQQPSFGFLEVDDIPNSIEVLFRNNNSLA